MQTQAGRILVVDDQPANARVVSALLRRHGYEVTVASSGSEALGAIRNAIPDLMLLDLLMPGMDGFSVLEAMQHDPRLRSVPVICLTAMQDREQLVQAFEAGAVDYVTKPYIAEELMARVGAHVGLKLTRDRLERVARERQELVNLVAHDLKNPLSSVLFASDMLMQDVVKPERLPRYLSMIHDSADDALGYIRRYLESQDSARKAPATDACASLNGTLDWLRERYELQCEERGIHLRVTSTSQPLHARIDELVLRQVAENLVTNALKYATSGGDLHLCAATGADGYCRLVAEDRGPGIPAAKQRELFKPFTRLSDAVPENDISTGLGLSLAREIITQAGGQLYYEDRPGGGARFTIELPRART